MTKILHFNTSTSGGAFEAAYSIFSLLQKRQKWDLTFFSAENSNVIEEIYQVSSPKSFLYRQFFKRYYRQIKDINSDNKYELFSLAYHPNKYKLDTQNLSAIHLHWIDEWFDYKTFFESINDKIPIFWTLHDMSPFTGGCHSTLECLEYKNKCEICPQLKKKYNDKKISKKNFLIKKEVFQNKNLHIIASSEDMYIRAQASNIFPSHTFFHKIPLAIDILEDSHLEKRVAQKVLKIPGKKFVIGFVASDLNRPNKGLEILTHALKNIKDAILITFGYPHHLKLDIQIPHIHFGYIQNCRIKNLIYSAMDVLVVPSVFEPFGLVILEAMNHKIPVIASKIGGANEIIIENETGLLFENKNSDELNFKLLLLQKNSLLKNNMGENGFLRLRNEFSMEKMSDSYYQLYREFVT